jgi:hypothetical protein
LFEEKIIILAWEKTIDVHLKKEKIPVIHACLLLELRIEA